MEVFWGFRVWFQTFCGLWGQYGVTAKVVSELGTQDLE